MIFFVLLFNKVKFIICNCSVVVLLVVIGFTLDSIIESLILVCCCNDEFARTDDVSNSGGDSSNNESIGLDLFLEFLLSSLLLFSLTGADGTCVGIIIESFKIKLIIFRIIIFYCFNNKHIQNLKLQEDCGSDL